MIGQTCEWCDNPLPADARRDQRFCSRSHKNAARRKRRELEKRKSRVATRLGSVGPLSQSSQLQADSREADARFHALLAAEEARHVTDQQAAQWKAYARRHGSIHPDEQVARLARGREARLADWHQGTERFVRPSNSIAEQARASRAQQARPAPVVQDPGRWDNLDDPELLEPATMHDGNIFKGGYRHAAGYR